MIGRADIEGSKSDVAMNAWPPQASYPCGNFSDTSCLKPKKSEERARRAGDAPCSASPPRGGADGDPTSAGAHRPSLSLRHGVSLGGPLTHARVRLLGPCFKTGRVGCRHRCRPLAPVRGPVPARRCDTVRCALRTVRPGRQSRRRRGAPSRAVAPAATPPYPREGEDGAWRGSPGRRSSGRLPRPWGKRRGRGRGAVTLDARATSHLPLGPFQADPEPVAAHRRGGNAHGGGRVRPGGRSREGIRTAPARPTWPAELNPLGGLRGPHPFTSQRFHALFKVLFNFP
ncbi:hypothetical protein SKAU_G00244690 [Synaphobranchus kaupii]|uniref:Senescence-associated protein n=1 Tax=Synaphobranchus kaupii TaxID=118154 RepID=A0A9Q1IP90_SYNKA|nr:hypothetical protein SKAU_G00244690 [Synaphobranchus kaupii]